MCGRYTVVSSVQQIEKRFNVKDSSPSKHRLNVNVSPGDYAPIISSENPNQISYFRFGLTPFWAKKPMYFFNARSEGDHNKENRTDYTGAKGIISKPSFRKPIRSQRCLIIADAFLEGPEKEKLSKPYLVYLRDKKRPFAFAGIWDTWVNTETGEIIQSHAIITTVSNKVTQEIGHHRSPVILTADQERDWLNADLELDDVTSMLKPYPAEEMNTYPISNEIKHPAANGLELLEPIGAPLFKEYDYQLNKEIKLEGMGMSAARKRKNNEND